jgi:hypothetical protein
VANPVEVGQDALIARFKEILAPEGKPQSVIWRRGESEVVAHLSSVKVAVEEGLVIAAMTLESAETGRADVTVPFAVGGKQLASMFATTERRPRGPAELVDRWGDAVIATLWSTLLKVARSLAADAGRAENGRPLEDADGQPLVPAQLIAQPGKRLAIVPQARHPLDRVPRP